MSKTPDTFTPRTPHPVPIVAIALTIVVGLAAPDLLTLAAGPAWLVWFIGLVTAMGFMLVTAPLFIPVVSGLHTLITDPECRPLAMFLGLVALLVLANIAWEIVQRLRLKRRQSLHGFIADRG
ncbi:MAG: hypothetical protein AB1586_33070 [Pseudomonadota bacterium]|jgi:hypothetical protein